MRVYFIFWWEITTAENTQNHKKNCARKRMCPKRILFGIKRLKLKNCAQAKKRRFGIEMLKKNLGFDMNVGDCSKEKHMSIFKASQATFIRPREMFQGSSSNPSKKPADFVFPSWWVFDYIVSGFGGWFAECWQYLAQILFNFSELQKNFLGETELNREALLSNCWGGALRQLLNPMATSISTVGLGLFYLDRLDWNKWYPDRFQWNEWKLPKRINMLLAWFHSF